MCANTTRSRRHATMMSNAYRACLLAFLLSTAVQGLDVEIEPKGSVAVRQGDSLKILCKVAVPISLCRVVLYGIMGQSTGVVLNEGQKLAEGFEYYGEGKNAGQCGIHIPSVREEHNGEFLCGVAPKEGGYERTATMKIVVAKSPNNPELRTSASGHSGHRNVYRKGEKMEISCSAPGGRPPANISLYIDDEPIYNEERPMYYGERASDNENYLSTINASRTLEWTDNGRVLRCIANHIALDRPKETTMQLQVYYPPQPQPVSPLQYFDYKIGQRGTVNVTVYANPRPHFLWRINGMTIAEGRPDDSNRLLSSTAVDLGNGAWSNILTIDSVQKSDTEKDYILEARNDEGANEYHILLSTSPEPAGFDLDAGSIIGIVVGILVLILAVFLVIFARATGRWCFAGGSSSRNLGETSDTESAGRYSRSEIDGSSSRRQRRPRISLSRLFKRNKDKVSGADTDTVRTVVTVDEGKIQAGEAVMDEEGKTNPASTEGGLVYAELDLTQRQQGVAASHRLNDDKTEYAEILYTKSDPEEAQGQSPQK